MNINESEKFLEHRFTDGEFDEIARFNVESFFNLKMDLVNKRKSICTIEQIAEELGKTPKEMEKFEAYYSDQTISQIRTYALALGMKIHIKVEDYEKDKNNK